jgi:hypothetical protein
MTKKERKKYRKKHNIININGYDYYKNDIIVIKKYGLFEKIFKRIVFKN